MAVLVTGKPYVFGIPPCLKMITGIPRGAKIRLRFRADRAAKVFVRLGGQITAHYIEIDNPPLIKSGVWCLGPAIGRNQTN